MIPLATLRTDLLRAFCVIGVCSSALVWAEHTPPTESHPIVPIPTVAHKQSATVIIPTLIPYVEATTTTVAATTTISTDAPTTTAVVKPKNSPRATIPTTHPSAPKAQTVTTASSPITNTEYLVILARLISEKTNAFRKSHGLGTFTLDSALVRSATTYSQTMLTQNFLSHTDKKGCDMTCRFTRDGYDAWAWGENLAVLNFGDRPTPEYVANYFMSAWEKSADHRANLLNPVYTNEGIGIAMNGTHIYATVQFAQPK